MRSNVQYKNSDIDRSSCMSTVKKVPPAHAQQVFTYYLVVFIVYVPNPLEYVGTMTWQEKVLTRVRSFLSPVFFARGGDGSNELESVMGMRDSTTVCRLPLGRNSK